MNQNARDPPRFGFMNQVIVRAEDRNPVLLIHGFYNSGRSMRRMQRWLKARGWNVYAMNLVPSDGRASLEQLARQIAMYVDETFPNNRKLDIVGFSMGGLVSRCYVQRLNGGARVNRLITIAAPHHGTWLAYLSRRPGCREMRPGSALLNALNNDVDSLKRVRLMSIWTPLDLMIIPASSSRMEIGAGRKTWIVAHRLMILQRSCFRQVEQFLLDVGDPHSQSLSSYPEYIASTSRNDFSFGKTVCSI